jgi:DNA-binding NarL/FixJ family response regulator
MIGRGWGCVSCPSNTQVPGVSTRREILIVEDHRMLAETLELALTTRGFRCHIADLQSPQSIANAATRIHPDLVLLDLDLGAIDGLQLVRSFRAGGQRVLIVTGCEDHRRLAAAVALGAVGWALKTRPFEEILQAAEASCRDRPLLQADSRDDVASAGRRYVEEDGAVWSRISALTPREREILNSMIRGETADDMADRFVISVGTARAHIRAVLAKLGVSSQLAAAALAVQWSASKRGFAPDDLLVPQRSRV